MDLKIKVEAVRVGMKFFKTEKINKTKDSLKTIITKNSKEANENCKKEQRTLTMVWALDSMPAACLLPWGLLLLLEPVFPHL